MKADSDWFLLLLLSLLRNSARGERWQVSRNYYLPCFVELLNIFFLFLSSSSKSFLVFTLISPSVLRSITKFVHVWLEVQVSVYTIGESINVRRCHFHVCVCMCVRSVTFALRDFRIRRRVFLLFFIPSFACSLAPPLAFSPLFSILFWKRRKKGKKNRARNAERSFFPSSTPLYPSPSRGSTPWLKCYNPPRALPLDEKKSVSIETGCRSPFVPFYFFFFFNFFSSLQTTFFFFAFVVHWASCSAKSFLFISKAGSLLLLIFLC